MGWLVATADSKEIDRIVERVEGFNFCAYQPKYRMRTVVRGRKVWQDKLLFGRYFFVRFATHWRSLFKVHGISNVFMSSENTPSIVSDEDILAVQSTSIRGCVRLSRFVRGQPLAVVAGAFQNTMATYEGMGKADREIVLVHLMGRETRVEIPSEDLVSSAEFALV